MLRFFLMAIVALAMAGPAAAAGKLRPPTLGEALSAGGTTVPAAWAGVWAIEDTAHTCADPSTITNTDAGFDTLCTGAVYQEQEGGFELDCSGTADDNSADITCTASTVFFPGCSVQFTTHLVATRNGDSFYSETTINTTFTPPLCAFQPDSCEVIETTGTRIAPEPLDCSTPVQSSTWGALKVRYR